jgi:hypothetical protein
VEASRISLQGQPEGCPRGLFGGVTVWVGGGNADFSAFEFDFHHTFTDARQNGGDAARVAVANHFVAYGKLEFLADLIGHVVLQDG